MGLDDYRVSKSNQWPQRCESCLLLAKKLVKLGSSTSLRCSTKKILKFFTFLLPRSTNSFERKLSLKFPIPTNTWSGSLSTIYSTLLRLTLRASFKSYLISSSGSWRTDSHRQNSRRTPPEANPRRGSQLPDPRPAEKYSASKRTDAPPPEARNRPQSKKLLEVNKSRLISSTCEAF